MKNIIINKYNHFVFSYTEDKTGKSSMIVDTEYTILKPFAYALRGVIGDLLEVTKELLNNGWYNSQSGYGLYYREDNKIEIYNEYSEESNLYDVRFFLDVWIKLIESYISFTETADDIHPTKKWHAEELKKLLPKLHEKAGRKQ